MKLQRVLIAVATASVVSVGLLAAGSATAAPKAATTLTIKAQKGDISGTISSPAKRCENNRKVVVYKQVGTVQDPANDIKTGSDISSLQNGHYAWSTGNSGTYGKVYARAPRTTDCKAGSSKTVRSPK